MALQKLPTRRQRMRQLAVGLAGLVFLPAVIAWTSVAFPAWAANMTASMPFNEVYRVVDIKGVSNFHEVELTSASTTTDVAVWVKTKALAKRDWNTGDTVCLRGRSSTFGTIIESISKEVANCS